ncbi:transglutaminase family protein [Kineosporia sp. R_H_3]|uniref:transglutaminase-like domain-containing protein n=1 Tax=Kineosporia sp. R_H_3 TaxID=1961848 RepID=UPI000B4B6415|nr:transglutaminase domain-containing protein [Kineosporia sp. R_H_3]
MPSLTDSPAAPAPSPSATVGAHVVFDVREPSLLALQVVAANDDGASLRATLDGTPVEVREVRGPAPFTRQHLVECGPGTLEIAYDATVQPGSGAASTVDEAERILMLRPSRYCPADRFTGYGATRFPGPDAPALERLRAITDHVHDNLQYVSGSTGPTDDAVDVLLAGQGVCRDYAHLVVTLARAAGMAARLVAVYAPGLFPMDFHAVAEVEVDGVWHVVDATRLAPRESLVRICTGRDAADTAWCTTLTGVADLRDVVVTAVADQGLPTDDGDTATTLS